MAREYQCQDCAGPCAPKSRRCLACNELDRQANTYRPRLCVHCGGRPPSRPRGLCWRCYYTPGVREQYLTPSKYASRSPVNHGNLQQLPLSPVCAIGRPGTPEKIEELERRAAAGEELWHPGDRRDRDTDRGYPVPQTGHGPRPSRRRHDLPCLMCGCSRNCGPFSGRGCCGRCYNRTAARVAVGRETWEQHYATGRARPPRRKAS